MKNRTKIICVLLLGVIIGSFSVENLSARQQHKKHGILYKLQLMMQTVVDLHNDDPNAHPQLEARRALA